MQCDPPDELDVERKSAIKPKSLCQPSGAYASSVSNASQLELAIAMDETDEHHDSHGRERRQSGHLCTPRHRLRSCLHRSMSLLTMKHKRRFTIGIPQGFRRPLWASYDQASRRANPLVLAGGGASEPSLRSVAARGGVSDRSRVNPKPRYEHECLDTRRVQIG